jgi:hypothetical protein
VTTPATTVAAAGSATTVAAAGSATTGGNVASHMTKDSGVSGIPVPDDAVADTSSKVGLLKSNVGTINEVANFYLTFMMANGWTYKVANSELDPAQAKKKSLGFIADMVFCQASDPVTTVAITVGAQGNAEDLSTRAIEIAVADDPGAASCP